MSEQSLRVSKERWRRAQAWEYRFWLQENSFLIQTPLRRMKNFARWVLRKGEANHGPGDDWNTWWKEQFNQYQSLPSQFQTAIELGCGPYTNMRLIREGRTIDQVVLSDPLAPEYLRFHGRGLAQQHKNATASVLSHSIEACPFPSSTFDLVVVINVLDHVEDALRGVEEMLRILRPDGYLVFGQDLTNEEDMENLPRVLAQFGETEDVGHPIRIHHESFDSLLLKACEPMLYKILPREAGRSPEAHYGTYCFIGKKRA